MRRKALYYVAVILASFPAMAIAGEDAQPGPDGDPIVFADRVRETTITVLASGTDDGVGSTGQSVSIIGAEEIAAVQGADVLRVLERVPGVTATRNGGLGGFAGVRVRGAEAEQLLVVVDGVRLADPGSPGAGFDFGTLLPYGIGKIELLRGSNSTIWGSQAIGGILAVTSAGHRGVRGTLEFGAHDSLFASGDAGGRWSGGGASFGAALVDTDGFSAAAAGSEPDAFRHAQVAGRVWQAVNTWLTIDAAGQFRRSRVALDGLVPPLFVFADTSDYQRTRQAAGRLAARLYWRDLSLDGSFSLADTRRAQVDPSAGPDPAYVNQGRSERAELRGRWAVAGPFVLRFGGEREWTRFDSTFDARKRAASTGLYAQLGYLDDRVAANAGLRRDDHSGFGNEWNFGADARVAIVAGLLDVHASYGEGFKAPSLFQLFSDFGNPALQPERSRSFDVGVGIGDRNAQSYFDVTLFRRDTRGLIGFVSCTGQVTEICADRPFGTYDNVGRTRARGVELEGGFNPFTRLGLRAAYAFVEAVDRTPGSPTEANHLPRRPRHALTLTGEWRVSQAITLATDLRLVSASYDDAANLVRMDGYEVLTIRTNWEVSDRVALFGRLENVLDERYETAAGYATGGRAAHVGVRASL